ncbi:MAG: EamA family transporter [Alphaproteobacteria bacterium]|nr:EamA family transporter [Alphaproteobacteria bacterium]
MKETSPPNRFLPIALLLMIGGLWGFFFILIKNTVTNGIHPTAYVFWFCLGSGMVVLFIGLLRGSRPPLSKRHLAYYFQAAALRFTFANIILYAAQGKLPVGVMAVIMAFTPIFTHLVSLVARIEKLAWLRLLGILLGFIGVLIIVIPKASLPDPALAIWVLIGFGTPLLHGLAYVFLSDSNRPPDIDSLQLAAGTLLAAAVMALPISLAVGEFHILAPPFTNGELSMMLHFVLAGFNFYAVFELIRIAGPTYMSQSSFMSVVFGVFFGIVLLGEQHSLYIWVAIALILGGVALVNARQGKR